MGHYELKIGTRVVGEYATYMEASEVWESMGRPLSSICWRPASQRRAS